MVTYIFGSGLHGYSLLQKSGAPSIPIQFIINAKGGSAERLGLFLCAC